jgi:F-type H+-transporting ATPase subunit delta
MATPRAAIRYAKSLFSLAQERGELDNVERDMRVLHQAVESSRDLELMLKSPVIKSDAKEKILKKVFGENISALSMEFVNVLVRKGRESILPSVIDEALGLVRKDRNIRLAEVKSAVPLDDDLRSRVSATLKKLHDGEVELQETVDPELLGGFQLLMDNQMVDASLKRELELLRRQLTDHDYEPEF